ncbi:short-chain dehydrogenase/reductase-like protein [Cadophora sp. DSE1049]|nr:short-chain dehydrogenase/reductase-like protein [Cadophora sp. DSE1049]
MPKPSVLITGCSEGGIGHSLALAFARQNYTVFATARTISKMSSMSNNPNITLIELDVTSPTSIQSAFDSVTKATNGKLDILYHNAGVRSITIALHSDWALAEWTFRTNLFAVVELTKVFMPLILKAGAGSKIVFSNSVAAVAPIPTQVLYDASKAALKMYADVLRLEVRPLDVHVVNIMTGSPYMPIVGIINKSWSVRKTVMPVGEYSTQVVAKVSQPNPPNQIWLGGNAALAWAIELFGMQWVYGLMFRK